MRHHLKRLIENVSVFMVVISIHINSFSAHSTSANDDVIYSYSPIPSITDDSSSLESLLRSTSEGVPLSRKLRYLLFPEGASTGIWVDLTIPLGLPMENIFVSMNFEANYNVIDNVTQLPYQALEGRRLTRRKAYSSIESWLSSLGMHGRSCLLRTICETVENTLVRNGLASEIIHWLFTPSASSEILLDEDIKEAERLGRTLSRSEVDGRSDVNCRSAYPSCPLSPFDLFTVEEEIEEEDDGYK